MSKITIIMDVKAKHDLAKKEMKVEDSLFKLEKRSHNKASSLKFAQQDMKYFKNDPEDLKPSPTYYSKIGKAKVK